MYKMERDRDRETARQTGWLADEQTESYVRRQYFDLNLYTQIRV